MRDRLRFTRPRRRVWLTRTGWLIVAAIAGAFALGLTVDLIV
jgi:hypothetical protein